MSQNVLVTGGTGFIGSALVRRLVNDGHDVRVFDNDSRGRATRLDDIRDDIEFVHGDIRDADAVADALAGQDAVWHLAYVNGTEFFYEKPDLVLDVGVKGMANVIDGCRTHDVAELIYASTSEVYQTPAVVPTPEDVQMVVPDPTNPRYSYGSGKIIGEMMALHMATRFMEKVQIFRPHNVYGPDMGWEHVLPQFVLRMKELCEASDADPLPFPIQGEGLETRAFNYIDDFIDGVILMSEKGASGEIYHIGTPEEITIRDVAHMVGAYFGRTLELVPQPLQKGGTPRRCPDISKITAIGYEPKFMLSDGFPVLADWYTAHADQAPK
ncbi:MAG: SDR family NAD(P)-dependent oxidoreductase [Rhodospirillales bacterium]|nr:SDR family NAD(P)-dependent oxidoreductase [Rhodospirillales bacterium]MBO6787676.1 SDR family NAD(P)-dependent oxidoreductase [Rhodospirillales bacterium]